VNLGFTIVEKLTVLGLEIDGNGHTESNYQSILNKIKGQLGIWRPFNLSLPGRISIAKSMLYSQINYLGCFLPMPENILQSISHQISSFVRGNLNIAEKRIYLPVEEGGLGLFPVSDYLDAQRCAWIKRCTDFSEPWKLVLYISNYGCIFNSKAKNINKREFPICHTICSSYEKVSDSFAIYMENYKKSYIFDCRKFTLDLESRELLNYAIFNEEQLRLCTTKLYSLRYCDLHDDNGNFLSIAQIGELLNTVVTPLQVFHLGNVCNVAKIQYSGRPMFSARQKFSAFNFRR
jgi:hypothetical protein